MAAPLRIRIPYLAAKPVLTITAVGAARPNASRNKYDVIETTTRPVCLPMNLPQGQADTQTANEKVNDIKAILLSYSRIKDDGISPRKPKISQVTRVRIEIDVTTGTKYCLKQRKNNYTHIIVELIE